MKILDVKVLVGLVIVLWLISEFGPEEASGAASVCGILVAVVAILKLNQQMKKDKEE